MSTSLVQDKFVTPDIWVFVNYRLINIYPSKTINTTALVNCIAKISLKLKYPIRKRTMSQLGS